MVIYANEVETKEKEIKRLITTYILRFAVVDCVCYNEDFVKSRFCCINFYCNFWPG